MKRFLVVLAAGTFLLMGGCGYDWLLKTEKDPDATERVFMSTAPQIMFDKIIAALDARDNEQLKGLFSSEAIETTPEIDEQIADLIGIYEGSYISSSNFYAGPSTGQKKDGEWTYMVINPTGDVKTDKTDYRIEFISIPVSSDNENEVGVWRICLWLKGEEESSDGHIVGCLPDV